MVKGLYISYITLCDKENQRHVLETDKRNISMSDFSRIHLHALSYTRLERHSCDMCSNNQVLTCELLRRDTIKHFVRPRAAVERHPGPLQTSAADTERFVVNLHCRRLLAPLWPGPRSLHALRLTESCVPVLWNHVHQWHRAHLTSSKTPITTRDKGNTDETDPGAKP